MKRYLIAMITMVLLAGCAPTDNPERVIAEVTLQDGSVVSGYAKGYVFSNNFARVTIDGIEYTTDAKNITIIKGDVRIDTD